jgi:drug/metabolite transporter (DMT)-like permease
MPRARFGLVFLALLLIQLFFGVNYVLSKVIVASLSPLVWASIRIVSASLLMLPIALLSGRPHPRWERGFFVPLIGFALLGIVINQSCFLMGLRLTTATNSAVLNTLIPIFTLAIVTVRGQEPLSVARACGFISAFLGVLVIRRADQFSLSDATLPGDLLTIVNSLSYALFLSVSKRFIERHDRIWTTAWLFFYGSVGITLVSIPEWSAFRLPELSPLLLGSMVFAVLGATLATYFLSVWALAQIRASSVALSANLQPIVAAFVAWIVLSERPTLRVVASSLLILAGMILGFSNELLQKARVPRSRRVFP